MAKKKDIVEDVIIDEVKPDEEIKDVENEDIASNEDLTGKDESKDIEAVEENQEDITEESQPDEEESPVIDEEAEDKPEVITLDEVKPDDLPPIEVIDSNNKPINNDAIGDVGIPQGFAPLPKNKKIGTMGSVNGRIYKIISETHAIWCDNGAAFLLSNLK